jgi:hypothetical protein
MLLIFGTLIGAVARLAVASEATGAAILLGWIGAGMIAHAT